ncbi:Protein NEF1 [Oopsacas minuta]|uniref:Dolichyl-diphosphooligosaccharide-protein glycosyltransferase subunit TMEM258 n=1 Tax=Oopsacas minuta TaxID=111878 RepID=A0AAV7JYS9_9METZ|nr:Protein NEF1 [Oopsacas minuta]
MEKGMLRHTSPVNPLVYPYLAVALTFFGVFLLAYFFVYEVTSNKFTRSLLKELMIGLVSSVFLASGVLFLLLWVGIYV